jgi:hypothetical protein
VASNTRATIEDLLYEATSFVVPVPDREPWEYGWSLRDYRNSSAAAILGSNGPVAITGAGLAAYEKAVERLAKESPIRARWRREELWGIVASLVARAASTNGPQETVNVELDALRRAEPTLVVLPLANVLLPKAPLTLARSVIGLADDSLAPALDEAAGDRASDCQAAVRNLAAKYKTHDDAPLAVFVTLCQGQSMLAVDQAERRARDLLDLALLLEPNPARLKLSSLRGPTNRPGVRGVTTHRPAMQAALTQHAPPELAADIALVSNGRTMWHTHWHSTDPFPLDQLLAERSRRLAIERCLTRDLPIQNRLVVAARWYAEAHWATDAEDAVLALGIALDALIGSRAGLPGRAMRERLGLLDPNLTARAARSRRYSEIFAARSAVAHGGSSERLVDATFIREMAADVVWTAYRMLALDALADPQSEQDVNDSFEQLRWGTLTWS